MSRLRDFLCIGAVAVAALLAVGCGHDAQHPETSVSASSAPASSPSAQLLMVPTAEAAPPASQTGGFDGQNAYDHVAKLVAFGPHSACVQRDSQRPKLHSLAIEGFRMRN